MFSIAEREWKQQIHSKPKLRTYVKFKERLDATDYVRYVTNRYDRSMIAKFRCGILQLHIETGRFNQVKVEDRICSMCDDNMVEDEFHFLCQCDYYSSERKALYEFAISKNASFANLTEEEKFCYLMVECNCKVGKFINKAWQKRKLKLYN